MTIAITRHPTDELADRDWRTEEIVQPDRRGSIPLAKPSKRIGFEVWRLLFLPQMSVDRRGRSQICIY